MNRGEPALESDDGPARAALPEKNLAEVVLQQEGIRHAQPLEHLDDVPVLKRALPVDRLTAAATLVFAAGVVSSLVVPDVGVRVAGAGALGLGLWLLRYDIARRTVRQRGAVRYIAICVLLAAIWRSRRA